MDWESIRLWGKDVFERAGSTFWQCLVGAVYVFYKTAESATPGEPIGLSDINWLAAVDVAALAAFLAMGKGALATMFNNPSSASFVDLMPKPSPPAQPQTPVVIPTPDRP